MKFKMKFLISTFILVFISSCPLFSKNIAIIPFTNIAGDAEKNWIGTGFSETLATKLGKLKEINVIEREKLSKLLEELKFQHLGFVDENKALKLGKIYGVDILVLGSYQIIADKMKVCARFVDVETAKVIETAEETGHMSDIFKLQDNIALSLISGLKIVLGEKGKEEIKINPTENLVAYEWFSKARDALLVSRDIERAIEYYTKAIELDENFLGAYYDRGVAYLEKNLVDKAFKDFNKTIGIDPKYAALYLCRGKAYRQKGLLHKAVEDYTKAIELDPKMVFAYLERAAVYSYDELKQYDKAIEDCNNAIKLDRQLAQAYCLRGFLYREKGLEDLWIKDVEEAAALGDEKAKEYFQKIYDDRIKFYTRTIKSNPKNYIAYFERAKAFADKGLYDETIKDLNSVIKLEPGYAAGIFLRGIIYSRKGFLDEAIQDYSKVIELDPGYALAYRNRGNAYYNKGATSPGPVKQHLYDKAIEDFSKAIQLDPEDGFSYYNRGVAYYSQGLNDLAIVDFKKAADLGYYEARRVLKGTFGIDY